MMETESPLSLEVINESAMRAEDDSSIRDLLCDCFPAFAESFRRTRSWHDCAPEYSVICRDGDRMLGHIAVVFRAISCSRGNRTVRVAGVQGVAVTPSMRGTGLSQRLMSRALREAARRDIHFGLLFCLPGLQQFYDSLGWTRTRQPITMLNESGQVVPLTPRNISMYIELSDRLFPLGPLDLQGRDW